MADLTPWRMDEASGCLSMSQGSLRIRTGIAAEREFESWGAVGTRETIRSALGPTVYFFRDFVGVFLLGPGPSGT